MSVKVRSLQLTFDRVPPDAVVVRRSVKRGKLRWRRWYLIWMTAFLVYLAFATLRVMPALDLVPSVVKVIAVIWIALIVVLGVVVVAEARWRRLIVSPADVTLTGVAVRNRVARSDVDHVRLLGIRSHVAEAPGAYLVGHDGTTLMRLPPRFDMEELGATLGVPVRGEWDDRADLVDINARLPGAVPAWAAWLGSHPFKLGAIAGGLALLLVVAIVAFEVATLPHR